MLCVLARFFSCGTQCCMALVAYAHTCPKV